MKFRAFFKTHIFISSGLIQNTYSIGYFTFNYVQCNFSISIQNKIAVKIMIFFTSLLSVKK